MLIAVIDGFPGSGKTFLCNEVKRRLEEIEGGPSGRGRRVETLDLDDITQPLNERIASSKESQYPKLLREAQRELLDRLRASGDDTLLVACGVQKVGYYDSKNKLREFFLTLGAQKDWSSHVCDRRSRCGKYWIKLGKTVANDFDESVKRAVIREWLDEFQSEDVPQLTTSKDEFASDAYRDEVKAWFDVSVEEFKKMSRKVGTTEVRFDEVFDHMKGLLVDDHVLDNYKQAEAMGFERETPMDILRDVERLATSVLATSSKGRRRRDADGSGSGKRSRNGSGGGRK